MLADQDLTLSYLNESMLTFMKRHEAEIQKQVPGFRVAAWRGSRLDQFQIKEQDLRQLTQSQQRSLRARVSLGSRVVNQEISLMRDAAGGAIGYCVEWTEVTDRVLAQRDVERVLEAALAGDLTQRIETSGLSGFVASIGTGINRLLDSVGTVLSSVQLALVQVGQASQELSATSQLMASGAFTLNQAANDSSAGLTRAAQMARTNADSAAMANQIVSATQTAAVGGQERMREMSLAMSDINESAQRIAKIIKVIDEIAFQTNLLALNAAVEAARAGRHGKGFSVVAQEVRSLAERSAKAAKETAQLIADSLGKVSQGVRMADATSGALTSIRTSIGKVVDLAAEIASASGEQSRTIAAVGDAMSQVTESAEASSQQSSEVAAAAEELGRQMDVMRERVQSYKVPNPRATSRDAAGMLAQLSELLRARCIDVANAPLVLEQLEKRVKSATAAAPPPPPAAKPALDPRAILPLDRDERGFRGF
ncbi:MAG TPA: methyl-accepting chemotaxis protein [Polyangiales bacterium]|nr:methyl-accepting chemotaxis protein [Polyangiales bacterium]